VILLMLVVATAVAGHAYYNLQVAQPQGRYLLHAVSALAVLFVLGWREILPRLPPRVTHWGAAAFLLFVTAVNAYTLVFVAARAYYVAAPGSLPPP
jgi:hypothetical protein